MRKIDGSSPGHRPEPQPRPWVPALAPSLRPGTDVLLLISSDQKLWVQRSCVQTSLRSVCTHDLGQDSPIQTPCSVNKS